MPLAGGLCAAPTQSAELAEDLQAVAAAWSTLPDHARQTILSIVNAARVGR